MEIVEDWRTFPFDRILKLYQAVGWSNYTNSPESLRIAFENSTYVLLAVVGDEVIGLSRSMTDFVSIHYLQDIIVAPEFQRQGIGRKLLSHVMNQLQNVRTHMILTDDEEKQLRFYQSFGYKNTKDLEKQVLNTFVKMPGINLE